jgi:hypothetical protein
MTDPSFRTVRGQGAAAGEPGPEAGLEGTPPGTGGPAREAPGETAPVIIRRSGQGWRVADEEAPDLTSAIVLADLLAPGLRPPEAPNAAEAAHAADAAEAGPDGGGEAHQAGLAGEARRLRVTVAQLQHALATRVRVEQAIGVLAERRRIAPKAAFELLRGVARGSGVRLVDLAAQVVESAANPLLALPDELARPPRQPRVRGRSPRHIRVAE